MAKVNYETPDYEPVKEAYKKKNAAVDAALLADGAAYDAQRADIADTAADTLQQAYLQRMRMREGLAQQNKAAGITGGAAESSMVALEANYNTNRTNAMIQRDKQISQVNIAQQQAKGQAEMEKASNNVEMAQGELSFDQDRWTADQNAAWKMIDAGVINDELAKIVGWPVATLKNYYDQLKKAEEA